MAKKRAPKKRSLEELHKIAAKPSVALNFFGDHNSDTGKMGSWYRYDQKEGVLMFFPCNVKEGSEEQEWLLNLIREFHNKGHLLWKEARSKQLKAYGEFYNSNEDKNLLKHFEGVISKDDYNALKMALFVRYQSKNGRQIDLLKRDIRDKYGSRGINIANLCSAFYFEQFQEMMREMDSEEFNESYELAVGKRAKALFVHSKMGVREIRDEVDSMVDKSLRYRLDGFRIHAKGNANIEVVKQFVQEIEEEDQYTVRKEIENDKLHTVEYFVQVKPFVSE